jgi:hypothetical protein
MLIKPILVSLALLDAQIAPQVLNANLVTMHINLVEIYVFQDVQLDNT